MGRAFVPHGRGSIAYSGMILPRLHIQILQGVTWPAPGFEDTELGVLMEPEVGDGKTEVYPRVQA